MPYVPIRVPADLQRLVVNMTRENQWLEFKREPQTRNDQGRAECARDVGQFANASGGVLVVGAVGVFSATSEQDAQVAKAGADALTE